MVGLWAVNIRERPGRREGLTYLGAAEDVVNTAMRRANIQKNLKSILRIAAMLMIISIQLTRYDTIR